MFIAELANSGSGIFPSSAKSIISKIISSDEVGKTFGIISFVERGAAITGSLAFLLLYSATVSYWSGISFGFAILIYLSMIFGVCFCVKDIHKMVDNEEQENLTPEKGENEERSIK